MAGMAPAKGNSIVTEEVENNIHWSLSYSLSYCSVCKLLISRIHSNGLFQSSCKKSLIPQAIKNLPFFYASFIYIEMFHKYDTSTNRQTWQIRSGM